VQTLEIDKATIMWRCDLPTRDLRLLDPLFVYPSMVLGRERAIVVNLDQIRCAITADEVLLLMATPITSAYALGWPLLVARAPPRGPCPAKNAPASAPGSRAWRPRPVPGGKTWRKWKVLSTGLLR